MCQLDFLAKCLRHHDSELNYTLCTHFSYLNQHIIACVQLGISSWRQETQEVPTSDQVQVRVRKGITNLFTANEHRKCKIYPEV